MVLVVFKKGIPSARRKVNEIKKRFLKSSRGVVTILITIPNHPSEKNDSSRSDYKLIPPEFADPRCLVCERIIHKMNEIFEQDNTPCPDPREYCMSHLLEAVHASLIWRLSKL